MSRYHRLGARAAQRGLLIRYEPYPLARLPEPFVAKSASRRLSVGQSEVGTHRRTCQPGGMSRSRFSSTRDRECGKLKRRDRLSPWLLSRSLPSAQEGAVTEIECGERRTHEPRIYLNGGLPDRIQSAVRALPCGWQKISRTKSDSHDLLVEPRGIEPLTSSLRTTRSPN